MGTVRAGIEAIGVIGGVGSDGFGGIVVVGRVMIGSLWVVNPLTFRF